MDIGGELEKLVDKALGETLQGEQADLSQPTAAPSPDTKASDVKTPGPEAPEGKAPEPKLEHETSKSADR